MPSLPPPELILDALLYAVLPAALGAGLVTAAVECVWGTRRMPLGSALGLAAGAAAGMWSRDALTLMPGDSSWNRLPWLALAALAVGLATRSTLVPGSVRWVLRALAAAGIAWWLVPAETRTTAIWLAPTMAVVVLALWGLLEHLAARPPGSDVPLALAMSAFVAAGVLIHAGTARLTDAAVVLSASLGTIALVAWLRRGDAGGAVPGMAVLLPGLLLMGKLTTYSDVSWLAFALPALAPLALAAALPLRNRPGFRLFVLRLALVLIPLGAAIALAMAAGPLEFK